METVKIGDNAFEVIGYNPDDGLPIIRGIAVSTEDGHDEHGNKKISVNITIPVTAMGAVPGDNGGLS